MRDAMNKEVKVGDVVVFNHPNYRLLESSLVQAIVQGGISVTYHNPDDTVANSVIPEKQFVIISA